MKFTVKQGIVSAYGAFNVDTVYDSVNYPQAFFDGLRSAGVIDTTDSIAPQRGVGVAVTAAATTLAVVVDTANASYLPIVAPQWNTTWWITGKAVTGFTINFGTAAPTGGSFVDWFILEQ